MAGIGFAVALLVFGLADAVADLAAGRASLGSLKAATRLAPGNATYHSQLGRYLQITNGNLQQALQEYKRATELNPSDSSSWFDIARLEQVLGDSREQGLALERAIKASPRKPEVAWEAGNFYFLRGQKDQALQEFRVVLDNDPIAASTTIDMIWRVDPDIDELLERVIPPHPDVYNSLLSFLVSKKDTGDAAKAWSSLIRMGKPFSVRVGEGYVEYLLSQKLADDARDAWQAMAPLTGLTDYLPGQNLIVNPRFEKDVLNLGFDWRYYEQSSVKITLDAGAPGGSHGILVNFLGPGFSETGLVQLVSVAPSTNYEFSVHFKTDELEGAGGPVFLVRDEGTGGIYLTTETLKNPGSWREVAGHFETGPECRLISVRLARIPAGNAMRGHLWMDEVQLTKLEL